MYKEKNNIMKNESIRNKWYEFIKKYNHLFLDNYEEWELTYNKLINYIETNNKKPSKCSNNASIKSLGIWLEHNKKKYKEKINIMKNELIRNKWDELMKK